MTDERQPDYDAALRCAEHTSDIDVLWTRYRRLIRAGFTQGLAARRTPEELRAIGDAVVHLGAALDGGGLEAEDEVSIRRALPVLKALAGKGAG